MGGTSDVQSVVAVEHLWNKLKIVFGLEHVVVGAAVELLRGVDEVPTLCCEVLTGVFSDLAEVLYHFDCDLWSED